MEGVSEELIGAVIALRQAATIELTGNAFYLAEKQIERLFEVVSGGQGRSATRSANGGLSLPDALSKVKRLATGRLSGNEY